MPRALILGGTGVIGRATAHHLLRAGWDVELTGRDSRKFSAEVISLGGQYRLSDRQDPLHLKSAVGSGVDLLVDCVCYTARDALLLVPFARDATSTVMISSKGVYVDENGNHPNSPRSANFHGPIAETQRTMAPGSGDVNSREGYGANKVAAEHVWLESDVPVSVIRPSKVHGEGAVRPREWYFAKRALDGRSHVLLRNGGRNVDHPTAALNLAALIETVARLPGHRILNSADPDAPSVREIARTVALLLEHEWREVLLERDAPTQLGKSPWDCEFPIVLDTTAAIALGYEPVGTYAETVRHEISWLSSIAVGTPSTLPTWLDNEFFARSFDYDSEDSYLAPRTSDRSLDE